MLASRPLRQDTAYFSPRQPSDDLGLYLSSVAGMNYQGRDFCCTKEPSEALTGKKQRPPGEGPGHKHEPDHKHGACIFFTGKIEGICYDRFGDFEGFLLDTEEGKRRFKNREREVEELVHRAWMDRIVTTVVVEKDKPHRTVSIVLRGMPPKVCR